ncbi:MAG: hypothetical protein ACYTGL_25020 [Planctomycetota bacterium]|jgi:hypothetical protein
MSSALLLAAILSVSAVDEAPALVDNSDSEFTSTTTTGPFTTENIFHRPASPAAFPGKLTHESSGTSNGIQFASLDTSLIRGQSYDEDPTAGNLSQPTFAAPPIGMPFAQQGTIWPGTPLLAPNGMMGGPPPAATQRGLNGPQPFRFGWTSKFDVGYLPQEDVSSGGTGDLGIFEFNGEVRYSAPTPLQWIFSVAPQFNLRLWDGPTTPGLPGDVYRFGTDLQITSPAWGPYTFEFAVTPSLNTSFEDSPSSDAWNFDGRGAAYIRTSPQWLIVAGAMFWDRVNDRVLPYAGLVYTPNDYLEIRALFPKADISFFIGTPWGVPQWLYVAGEYHIEAYEVVPAGGQRSQVQIEDWRVVGGVRSEQAGMTSFLEGGWVFDRQLTLLGADADISSGFIVRFGVRW